MREISPARKKAIRVYKSSCTSRRSGYLYGNIDPRSIRLQGKVVSYSSNIRCHSYRRWYQFTYIYIYISGRISWSTTYVFPLVEFVALFSSYIHISSFGKIFASFFITAIAFLNVFYRPFYYCNSTVRIPASSFAASTSVFGVPAFFFIAEIHPLENWMVLVGRISHRIVPFRLFFEIEIFSKPRKRILERRNGTLSFVVEIRGGHCSCE